VKEIRYQQSELALVSNLKRVPPFRLLGDGHIAIVFDYGSSHVTVMPEELPTELSYAGAKRVRLQYVREPYRGSLWHIEFTIAEPVVRRTFVLETILVVSDLEWADTPDGLPAGYDEKMHPPPAVESSVANPRYTFVQAGFLLELENRFLGIFARENGFTTDQCFYGESEIPEAIERFYSVVEI
jgi:hypothetical protein